MQPGHRKPGGHAFLSDVSRGNGGVLRGRNGGGGRGVRATPRGPLRGPETAGSAENAPRGGLHGLPDTGPPALRGTRDPLPGSASVASGPQPAHARGWGVRVEGVSPPTPAGSCLLAGTSKHPPRRPSQPRGGGPRAGPAAPGPRRAEVSLRTHPRAAHNGARRPAAKCVSARAGLQLPDTPAARRARPLPSGGHFVWATRGSRRSHGDQEESLHPYPRGGPAGQGDTCGGGGRCNARPPSPNNPCGCGDAGQETRDARPGGRPCVG